MPMRNYVCNTSRLLLLAICLIFTLPLLLQHSNMALCQTPSSRESAPEKVSKFARLPSPQPEKARISVLLSVVRQDRDPDSRARAVWDLSDLWTDDSRIVPALLVVLRKDRDPVVRTQAALALGQIGRKASQVTSDLLAALRADADPHVRGAAALAVGLAGRNSPEVLAALIATFKSDRDPQVRGEAACALSSTRGQVSEAVPVAALVSAVIPVLESNDDPKIRATAAMELARLGLHDWKAVHALIEELKANEDPRLRETVAFTLGQVDIRDPRVVAALLDALQPNNDPGVRTAAANALSQIGMRDPRLVSDPTVERALVAALNADNEPQLRVEAANVLGEVGGKNSNVVRMLVEALRPDTDPNLRAAAAYALGQVAMRNPAASRDPTVVSMLLEAAKPDNDARLRQAAVWALGNVSAPDLAVVAGLVEAMQPKNDSQLRATAANALMQMGVRYPAFAGERNVVDVLIGALKPDNDLGLRVAAATALGQVGGSDPAVGSALMTTLDRDSDPRVRDAAAVALGSSGAGAGVITVVNSLIAALKADHCSTACTGSIARLAGTATVMKPPQLEMIPPLEAVDRIIRAKLKSDPSFDSPAARTSLDYIERSLDSLRWTANRLWRAAMLREIQAHPWIASGIIIYLSLSLTCLVLLWGFPLLIFEINERFRPYSEFSLPSALGGLKVPLSRLFVVGFFQYHYRVLDAWVARYLVSARSRFERITTVKDRRVHVEAPVQLDGEKILAVTTHELKNTFKRKLSCILIWGEGGAGKTSLACQLGKWAMSEDEAMLLCEHPMLPVIIEPDSILGFDSSHTLLDVTRGQLRHLTEEAEAPAEELVAKLLQRRRILVIIDGLSEFSTAARNLVRPDDPTWLANALVVTSRLEDKLPGPDWTVIQPLRIEGNRLSSFMDLYLVKQHKRELFEDFEFFSGCAKLSSIVVGRDITLLLAKLYAEQMIAQKEGSAALDLPRSVPELMLEYLNQLNSKVGGPGKLDDRTVHSVAKAVAWECLSQTGRPIPAPLESLLAPRGRQGVSAEDLKYLEERLLIVQVVGPGRDKVRFTLDPLAEYLAALDLVENYKGDELRWRKFFARAMALPGFPDSIRGFLLAVHDCCSSDNLETRSLAFAAAEINKMLAPKAVAA
jgi:HEAT repeat protein